MLQVVFQDRKVMEEFFKSLIQLDVHTIIVLGSALWYFNKKTDEKFDKMEARINERFEKMEKKFDERFNKLEEKVTDIDRRVCRMEGSLATKDCCMLKDDRVKHRAE